MARLIKRKLTKKIRIKRISKKMRTRMRGTRMRGTRMRGTRMRGTKKVTKRKYKGGGKWLNQHNPGVLENTLCPICYAEFKDTPEQAIYQTQCGHIFHNDCILAVCNLMQWNCPICRRPLSEGDCTDVYAFKEKVIGDNFNDPEIQKLYDATF
jgi:hypothetical protein